MFLLDANAFMEASRLYYAFDIAPGFWEWLGRSSLEGRVASVEAIRGEIIAGTGDLVTWARGLPRSFWLADTDDVVQATTELAQWAVHPARPYSPAAVDAFMASADLRRVAHAAMGDATVVTRERSAPESRSTIKIPDACRAFDIACTDPFSAYRELGLELVVWRSKRRAERTDLRARGTRASARGRPRPGRRWRARGS